MVASHKILVADDSAAIRMSIVRMIEQINPTYAIVEADNGKDCAQILSTMPISIAFVDIHMPGLSGLAALHLARSQGSNAFVVLMSTDFKPDFVEEAKRYAAYDYLKKPFDADAVREVLRSQQTIKHKLSSLVVDASKTVRRVIFKVLNDSRFAFSSSEAASGEMAINLCRTIPYDLIFMDYHMPGMDALLVGQEILEMQPKTRIVLITSHSDDAIVAKAEAAGFAGVLKMPFYPKDVNGLLYRLLGLEVPVLDQFCPAAGAGRNNRKVG